MSGLETVLPPDLSTSICRERNLKTVWALPTSPEPIPPQRKVEPRRFVIEPLSPTFSGRTGATKGGVKLFAVARQLPDFVCCRSINGPTQLFEVRHLHRTRRWLG